eukprot:scaffold11781_cov96-Isochrysis_galbana.AAC.7
MASHGACGVFFSGVFFSASGVGGLPSTFGTGVLCSPAGAGVLFSACGRAQRRPSAQAAPAIATSAGGVRG